ncbi:transposase [Candidatus Symbiobacter mobilis]|uniref:transposase n=1 Tax=Candidatus Symbiobacter mobilis TaxID=1436290 RepID=UPI003B75D209
MGPSRTHPCRAFYWRACLCPNAFGHLQCMLHVGSVHAEVLLHCLRLLMKDATRPVFRVVDGSSIHKTSIINKYLESTNGKLEVHFLPPYCSTARS